MSLSPTAARSPGITDWVREHRTRRLLRPHLPALLVGVALLPRGPRPHGVLPLRAAGGRDRRRRRHRRRPGYRDWGARMLRWRVGWVWWVVAIGTPLAVLALASAANVAIWGAPAPVLTALPWSSIALFAALRLVNPLDGPFGEEPGWRGYALPELQVRRSPLAAGLVLAPIVALWHVPLVTTGQLAARRHPHHVRHHPRLRLAVQPHRRQRAAHRRLPHRAGHVQLRRAGLHGCRRRPDGLDRRRAVVRHRRRGDRLRSGGVAGGAALGSARSTGRVLTCVASQPGRPVQRCLPGSVRGYLSGRPTTGGGMTSGLALPRGRGDTLLAQRFGAERRTSVVWVLPVGPRGRGDVRSARARAVPPRAVRAHRRRVPRSSAPRSSPADWSPGGGGRTTAAACS